MPRTIRACAIRRFDGTKTTRVHMTTGFGLDASGLPRGASLVLRGASVALIAALAPAQQNLYVQAADSSGENLGWSVAGGSDVDGDGHADWLLGAYTDSATAPEQGSVRVVSGFTGAELYTVWGDGKDELGHAVAFLGDVDGDGRADFVAGAPQRNLGGYPTGYVRVFSGATGAELWTHVGPSPYCDYGTAVCGMRDIDGDGRPEVAVGARRAGTALNLHRSGAVYVYSGATGALLHNWFGTNEEQALGWSVTDAGDVDGDGCDEIAFGVVGWDEPGKPDCGAIQIHSVCTGALLRRIPGLGAHEALGWSLSGGADLDGDGRNDLVAGAPLGTFDGITLSGGVRAYSGATGAVLQSWGGGVANSSSGDACAVVGDADGDGVADVAVGSPGQPAGSTCGGRADVYSGATGILLLSVCGAEPEDGLGRSLAGAGDVNGDGFADWIVGAPRADDFTSNAGAAYVVSGYPCAPPITYCTSLPNSVGSGAHIGFTGSGSVAWNRFGLTCSDLPPNGFGRFYFGTGTAQALFGDGYRCVAGTTWRLPIYTASAQGDVETAVDFGALPGGAVLHAGDVRHFQYWYRNVLPGGSGFNLSDGLSVTFCP